MIRREDLLKSEEYWFEIIQNDIFRMVADHLEKTGINQKQFAEELGVTKGYVSQIMKGNFNYTLKKLIELSIATGNVPAIEFKDIVSFINEDRNKRVQLEYQPYVPMKQKSGKVFLKDGVQSRITMPESDLRFCSNF